MSIIPDPKTDYKPEEFQNTSEKYHKKIDKLLRDRPDIAQRATELAAEQKILKTLRETKGFTQKELAEILEVSQAHVSKLEKQTSYRLNTLVKFIKATGGELQITAVYGDEKIPLPTNQLTNLNKEVA